MSLFGYFSADGKLRRLGKRLTEKFGPPENRQKAIATLAEMQSPEALSTLLMRFTINSDSRITDAEEKEVVFNHLTEAGEQAVGPLRDFVRQKDSVSWALRALDKLLTPEALLDFVLEQLNRLGGEYSRDPEKKVQLIGWLAEHHPQVDPRVAPALLPFLADMSDDVKIAAIRGLITQKDERAREPLLMALVEGDQSARVRREILEALFVCGFGIQGYREKVEAVLAEPYSVDKAGHLKRS